MLEYVLMRPIERAIFDKTRAWLEKNPKERFLIVLDEAHLYRGAAGAEVGLLLRRLRDRLGISPERFQVICATASFKDHNYAPQFGAQLAGVPPETFIPIKGEYAWRPHAAPGNKRDAEVLAAIDLAKFHAAQTNQERDVLVKPLLDHRQAQQGGGLEADLFRALVDLAPLGLLINSTMKQARAIKELGAVFDAPPSPISRSRRSCISSMARIDPKGPGLLPCRIHNFFRVFLACGCAWTRRAVSWERMSEAVSAARCIASRGNAASATRASTNSLPADIAAPLTPAPIPMTWTVHLPCGRSQAVGCGWKGARQVPCYPSTFFWKTKIPDTR
jgi:hypothetical protein